MNKRKAAQILNVKTAIEFGSRNLCHLENTRPESELILGHVLKLSRTKLYINLEQKLNATERELFEKLIKKRRTGTPIAYITGSTSFWSLEFFVTKDVLIPRPETELLVEKSLERIKNSTEFTIIDLGTGSGVIAGAIASEFPKIKIIATDNSEAALRVAKSNFKKLAIDNIDCAVSDWNMALGNSAASLIVANPPYVSINERHLVDQDVLAEPKKSVFADENGLAALRTVIKTSRSTLKKNGCLLVEHGFQQGESVRNFFRQENFYSVITYKDLSAHERVTLGVKRER